MRITAEMWKDIVDYDPGTGRLYWRPRDGSARYDKAFNTRFAGKDAGGRKALGYVLLKLQGRFYLAHRVAWAVQTGAYPKKHIDHINGVRDDNRWENLRDVTPSENLRNIRLPKTNTSGRIGVRFVARDKIWAAAIYAERKQIYLGSFKTKEDAIAARVAAEKLHGYHPNHGRPAA
ncbi:HNH endonuclease [Rhizobium johnstonii]|uniref:HNH endonuclease n=1 Tax=Rhizobium johnstonii TaxID=3019933 RepID=UPI003F9C8B45